MHLFFSVGEPSGDLHASKLIGELQMQSPGCRCSGLGGVEMEAAGCDVRFRLTDLAVMGIFAVIPLIGKFLSLILKVGKWLDEDRPDAVVLVDFPGFNWWVARAAKKRGIPVVYMMPPQMWAWASWRIHKMRRLVDLALCGLGFEKEWYETRGVRTELIGHPFFDEVAQRKLDPTFLAQYGSVHHADSPTIAILPGSRGQEVRANFPVQLAVMQRLVQQFPGCRFLVANYKANQRDYCQQLYQQLGTQLPIEFHVGKTSEILQTAKVCLMVSGSVSLEVLARKIPAVVLYRVGSVNWVIGRLLIRCKHISLPNLVADRKILPEYVLRTNDPAVVEQMANDLTTWLTDPISYQNIKADLTSLAQSTARPGATENAARILIEWLDHSSQTTNPQPLRRAA